MRFSALILWAGVSMGCWQALWAQQPQPDRRAAVQELARPADQVASVARQWWEAVKSQARQWAATVQEQLADRSGPQPLPSTRRVAKPSVSPEQPGEILLQPPSQTDLCPDLPEDPELAPHRASSLVELEGWFETLDQPEDNSPQPQAVPWAASPPDDHSPLVAPPPSRPDETALQEDRLVLEETSGCGCFDDQPEGLPLADLVRDHRHGHGQLLAEQLNEENDGLNDPPAVVVAEREQQTSPLAVTAPWLEDCDDFCHMEALGPNRAELVAAPAYTRSQHQAVSRQAEQLMRRGTLALERVARGFQEAWLILRYGTPEPQQTVSPERQQDSVPHNARRIREGDIGL